MVKNLPAMQETRVQSLGGEDPLSIQKPRAEYKSAYCYWNVTGPILEARECCPPVWGPSISCQASSMLSTFLTTRGPRHPTQAAPLHRCHLVGPYLGLNLGGWAGERIKRKRKLIYLLFQYFIFLYIFQLPMADIQKNALYFYKQIFYLVIIALFFLCR